MPTSVITAVVGAAISAGAGTLLTGAVFSTAFINNFVLGFGASSALPVEAE